MNGMDAFHPHPTDLHRPGTVGAQQGRIPDHTREPISEDERALRDLQCSRAVQVLRQELSDRGARVQTGFLHADPDGAWSDAIVLCGRTLEHWRTYTHYDTVQVARRRTVLEQLPDQYRPFLHQRGQARCYDHRLEGPAEQLDLHANHPGFVVLRPFLPDGHVDWPLPDAPTPAPRRASPAQGYAVLGTAALLLLGLAAAHPDLHARLAHWLSFLQF